MDIMVFTYDGRTHWLSEYPEGFRDYVANQVVGDDDIAVAKWIGDYYGAPEDCPQEVVYIWNDAHFFAGQSGAITDRLNGDTFYIGRTSHEVEVYKTRIAWSHSKDGDRGLNDVGMDRASWALQHAQGVWFLQGARPEHVDDDCFIYLGFMNEADYQAFRAAFPEAAR